METPVPKTDVWTEHAEAKANSKPVVEGKTVVVVDDDAVE